MTITLEYDKHLPRNDAGPRSYAFSFRGVKVDASFDPQLNAWALGIDQIRDLIDDKLLSQSPVDGIKLLISHAQFQTCARPLDTTGRAMEWQRFLTESAADLTARRCRDK